MTTLAHAVAHLNACHAAFLAHGLARTPKCERQFFAEQVAHAQLMLDAPEDVLRIAGVITAATKVAHRVAYVAPVEPARAVRVTIRDNVCRAEYAATGSNSTSAFGEAWRTCPRAGWASDVRAAFDAAWPFHSTDRTSAATRGDATVTIETAPAMVVQPAQQQQARAVSITWRNDNPNTIANQLAARLGRAPSDAELVAEVKRILRGESAPVMVPQPCQQQQANAALTVNVVAQWAGEAVKAGPFSERTMRGECHALPDLGVRLIQTGKDRFTVVYGKQVKAGLNYAQAAAEYGACIMHSLACDGMLDNRERGER